MGAHQDRDEKNFAAPVVSLSLGADCRFASVGRGGAAKRCRSCCRPATRWFWAAVATVLSRVDRVLPTLPALLAPNLPAGAARINLTLRRVS